MADAAWIEWQANHDGTATDERIRTVVAEGDADPRPSIAHDVVVTLLRSWGSDLKPPPR